MTLSEVGVMSLSVYTGLPATGKTSALIRAMEDYQRAGGVVVLFLSAEHPELTRRPNVRPGGLMGCRTPGLKFKIDHVLNTDETIKCLETLATGVMAVFDEAQYFKPEIVDAWRSAAERGVKILVGTPSKAQLTRLAKFGHKPIELKVPCKCGKKDATTVVYEENMTYPTHLCDDCHTDYHRLTLEALFEEMRESDPFPGENKTYQPFHDVEMNGWDFVRPDSMARYQLIQDAIVRHPTLNPTVDNADKQLTFMDLGCCSGFFCDAMTNAGFYSTGVDVTKNFINWAGRVAKLKGHNIDYVCEDARKFITGSDELIDVTSSFATIQWVMTQQGYEAGVECFKSLFGRTRHICVVEMGYTLEEIYKERIPDRPREIDKNWVLDIMQEFGGFAEIEVYPAGENGIWRDVFIGYKEAPARRPFRRQFDSDAVEQISSAQQFWDDKWTGQDFEVFLKAKRKIERGSLKGWIPDQVDGRNSKIAIYLNGIEIEALTVEGNEFECVFGCNLDEGALFSVRIKSTLTDMDSSADTRPLAFVMNDLLFS